MKLSVAAEAFSRISRPSSPDCTSREKLLLAILPFRVEPATSSRCRPSIPALRKFGPSRSRMASEAFRTPMMPLPLAPSNEARAPEMSMLTSPLAVPEKSMPSPVASTNEPVLIRVKSTREFRLEVIWIPSFPARAPETPEPAAVIVDPLFARRFIASRPASSRMTPLSRAVVAVDPLSASTRNPFPAAPVAVTESSIRLPTESFRVMRTASPPRAPSKEPLTIVPLKVELLEAVTPRPSRVALSNRVFTSPRVPTESFSTPMTPFPPASLNNDSGNPWIWIFRSLPLTPVKSMPSPPGEVKEPALASSRSISPLLAER